MGRQKLISELRKSIPVEQVANELERMRLPDGTGFTTGWFDLDQMVSCLAAASKFDDDICDMDRVDLCRNVVFDVATRGEVTKSKLQSAVARKVRGFQNRKRNPYVMLTTIGLRLRQHRMRLQHRGCVITIAEQPPSGFDRNHVPANLLKLEERPFYRRFASVRAHVRARSESEARARAEDAISYLRGLWNYSLNRTTAHSHHSDSTRPLNDVLPGPVTTLHHPNGSPATPFYWYQPFFDEAWDPFDSGKNVWKRVQQEGHTIRRIISRSGYRRDLEQLFARYCDAMDNRDHESSFLRLWGILEALTGTVGDSYDATVKRTAAVFAEPQLDASLLQLYRFQRNMTIHHGESDPHWRSLAVGLHRYVAGLLTFAVNGSTTFCNIDEMASFLSLSRDRAALQRQIELREQALSFRFGKGKGKSK